MLIEAYWNRDFAQVLESADLVTPDGMPLVWMLRWLGFYRQDSVRCQPKIGEILQKAGLLSSEQVGRTLQLQIHHAQEYSTQHNCPRFGEIIVQQGWIPKSTVDFFVVQLPQIASDRPQHPIGYYLKSAGFLDDNQINSILTEQAQTGLRFGELAVRKGYIPPETLHFLLQYILPAPSDRCADYSSMVA